MRVAQGYARSCLLGVTHAGVLYQDYQGDEVQWSMSLHL